jgi:transposase InsO family protein
LVTSLSTDAFLAALRRFAARRGRPKTIYSDNGTNFQGAAHQLHQLHTMFHSPS